MITGAQCRAARALVEWTRDRLAQDTAIAAPTIEGFERKISFPDEEIRNRLRIALERAGAVFISENGGGAGVRLKFSRSDVRRLGILEDEGGVVGIDDVP